MSDEHDGRMTRRGELRIYLGMAPGVGKTFAMLGEARRRLDRGTDVVVGLVETHGRAKTAELARRSRGRPAAGSSRERARRDGPRRRARPQARGGARRRARPHQRARLAARQALAGRRGAARRGHRRDLHGERPAPGVAQRRRRADHRRAAAGDRARRGRPPRRAAGAGRHHPEALRRRLAHGNVYAAEKVDAALANYFQPGNLTALRELALLWVADEVDVAVQRYRTEKNVSETWETRERVVVALTGDKESETVLRRAARIAKRSGRCRPARRARAARRRAGRRPGGGDPEAAAPRRGRRRQLPHRGRRRGRARPRCSTSPAAPTPPSSCSAPRGAPGSRGCSSRASAARVVQHSGTIDVHMVTHDEAGRGLRLPALHGSLSQMRKVLGWALAVVLPVAGDRPGWLWFGLSTDVVLYFLATVVAALVGGLGPAFLAALLGGAAAQLLPDPAAVLVHDRRAGERRDARRDGRRRGVGGAGRRPRGPARAAGRAGPRGGGAARLVRPHRAHPHRPAARGCWRRCASRSGCPRWRCWSRGGRRVALRRLVGPARVPGAGGRRRRRGRRGGPAPRRLRPHVGRGRPAPAGGGGRPGAAGAAQPARGGAGRGLPAPRRGHRDAQRAAVGGRARPAQPAHVDQGGRREPPRPEPAPAPGRPPRADRDHRGVRRPAHRAGRQPARLLAARRRARSRRCSRPSATTRWRCGRWPGSTARAA